MDCTQDSYVESPIPITVLIDDLSSTEVSIRLTAMKSLDIIARELESERTRDDLIPYLHDFLEDEDEILVTMAEKLGKLVPHIGGNQYVECLLDLLGRLLCMDDPAVRSRAIDSVCEISSLCTYEQINTLFVELTKNLVFHDYFNPKISACGLFELLYSRCSPANKSLLRDYYVMLCSDEQPMVRRSALDVLGNFVLELELPFVQLAILPVYSQVIADNHDTVRSLAVNCALALLKIIPSSDWEKSILRPLMPVFGDQSWRVKWSLIKSLPELTELIGRELTIKYVMDKFRGFLDDNEVEIRCVACATFPKILASCDSDELSHSRIILTKLVKDESNYVRLALSNSLVQYGPLIPSSLFEAVILPLFTILVNDPDPDVRLSVLSHISEIQEYAKSTSMLDLLMPLLSLLKTDPKWRNRKQFVEMIPILASQVGVRAFESNIDVLCFNWLVDPIHDIRLAMAEKMSQLTSLFGAQWIERCVICRLDELCRSSNYLWRLVALRSFQNCIIGSNDVHAIASTYVSRIEALASDKVPNVRLNVAKAFKRLVPILQDHKPSMESICTVTDSLLSDSDPDVRETAQELRESI